MNVSFSWDDSGLKKLQQNIDALNGQHQLRDLMTDSFIRQHSKFQSFQALVDASSIVNLEDIGNELFSQFIATHTTFVSWEKMLEMALAEYAKRQLGD